MARAIFTGKLLIDGTGRNPIKYPYIVVEEGIIQEVGSGRPPDALKEGADLVDMSGATIIPGIIDGHVHLGLGRNIPRTLSPQEEGARLAGLIANNARIALTAGVTTVADCGSRYGLAIAIRDSIAKGEIPGARIWAAGAVLTTTCGHAYGLLGRGYDSADELRKGVRETVWGGADFIKIMASGGSGTPIANRRRAQYSAEELRAAVEDAHRLNRRVHCHINAAEAMRNCIEAGVDVLEHCNWLGVEEGTIDYDDDAAKLAGKKGISAGLNCPSPFTPLVERDGSAQDWGNKTRWDLALRMKEAGVRVYINTDAVDQGLDMLPKYAPRMVEEGRATALETLQMITLTAAQAIGVDKKLGSLEKGKLGDMVFLKDNPLSKMATLTSPLMVIKEGKIAVKDGKIVF